MSLMPKMQSLAGTMAETLRTQISMMREHGAGTAADRQIRLAAATAIIGKRGAEPNEWIAGLGGLKRRNRSFDPRAMPGLVINAPGAGDVA